MDSKKQLIQKIQNVFNKVTLEDGIGLWEAQGLDDYATKEKCAKLRKRDEKNNWQKIPLIDLYKCSSSLSFFNAKGMRFHLPKFLLLDLDVFEKEEDKLHKNGLLDSYLSPDIYFTLTHKLEDDYSVKRFSALNNNQIQCVIDYFNYKIKERKKYHKEFGYTHCPQEKSEAYYKEIKKAICNWKNKLKQQSHY